MPDYVYLNPRNYRSYWSRPDQTMPIRWDWMREAYSTIKTTPDEDINLEEWVQDLGCRTLACAGGTIASRSVFKKAGLLTNENGTPIYTDPVDKSQRIGMGALCKFFNISMDDAEFLFGSRRSNEVLRYPVFEHEHPGTDRQVWLARVERFFQERGETL